MLFACGSSDDIELVAIGSDTKSSIIDSWKSLDGDIISAKINNETGL